MTEPRPADRRAFDDAEAEADGRLHAPHVARNAEPIRRALAGLIGDEGTVLEIGSGTGQHAAHLAAAFPRHLWVPSDSDPGHLASIAAWRCHAGLANFAEPLRLDAARPLAEEPEVAALSPVAVFAANVIHIAPWAVAEGIVVGAARLLRPGGRLVLYGPFSHDGRLEGEGNRRFDAALKAANPAWGIRDIRDVARLARAAGFAVPPDLLPMPANNRIVAFTRA